MKSSTRSKRKASLRKKRDGMFSFYEFFAGGGMARAGLGANWKCLFANDFDHKKSAAYRVNWGVKELITCDIRNINTSDLPDRPDLIWGSFPCQDLSLAGGGAGLRGDRSGTFWPFWDKVKALSKEGRGPRIIVLENVCGTLTSHGGKDFSAICMALSQAEYQYGAVVVDAALFVPQSRPRLFVIGVRKDISINGVMDGDKPHPSWHSRALKNAQGQLPPKAKKNWVWWNFSAPAKRYARFADLIEDKPRSVVWHTPDETRQLLSMMSSVNLAKVQEAKNTGKRVVGTLYKRTRLDENGNKVQRAEVRFDNIAGCLRTPAGGSSRQLILVVDGQTIKSRLISSRETARLMGLQDDYILPEKYNEAYHLTGDGVVVPVVRYLAEHVFEPILSGISQKVRVAA